MAICQSNQEGCNVCSPYKWLYMSCWCSVDFFKFRKNTCSSRMGALHCQHHHLPFISNNTCILTLIPFGKAVSFPLLFILSLCVCVWRGVGGG